MKSNILQMKSHLQVAMHDFNLCRLSLLYSFSPICQQKMFQKCNMKHICAHSCYTYPRLIYLGIVKGFELPKDSIPLTTLTSENLWTIHHISIIALLIITATGFKSCAWASNQSLCASSGIAPPPANGSMQSSGMKKQASSPWSRRTETENSSAWRRPSGSGKKE